MDNPAYSLTQQLEAYLLENRGALLGFIRSKVGDDDSAEDILQDSLLKALRATSDLKEKEKLVSWFYRIVRNVITDAHRRRSVATRRLEQYIQEQPTSVVPTSEDNVILCTCFEKLLPTLKPEYAELIKAMDLKETRRETIAQRLDITPNNLKVRHHRARRQLRERLEETCRTCAEHGCIDCTCES